MHGAGIVGGGHLSEVRVSGVGVDAVKFPVVKGVEGFEAQFERDSFCGREGNGLEQRQVGIEERRQNDRVLSCSAKALVRAALPWSERIGKRAGAEPCGDFLGIGDGRDYVRTVGGAAAQTERVGQAAGGSGEGSGVGDVLRCSGLCDGDAGDFPSAQGGAREQA